MLDLLALLEEGGQRAEGAHAGGGFQIGVRDDPELACQLGHGAGRARTISGSPLPR
jgi:hypothetical protein